MHQRDQFVAFSESRARFRQYAVSQTVDHKRDLRIRSGEHVIRRLPLLRVRPRKAASKIENVDIPAERAQFRDDTLVVGIAAGRLIKASRHREHDASHHKSAS